MFFFKTFFLQVYFLWFISKCNCLADVYFLSFSESKPNSPDKGVITLDVPPEYNPEKSCDKQKG